VRKFFDDYSKENKLTEKTVHDIQMALDELLTNIVNYGYEDTDEHQIDIHFGVNDDAVKVEIVDDSKPYNILEKDNPDISLSMEDKPIGGLGIFLIKKLMSNVDYYTEEGKNHLVMIKELG
jgi:anti-sigma regulatory factor (Ser/Thr protein kinase)